MLDWESCESLAFVNPRIPEMERESLEKISFELPGHIFLTTSGTERLKWVALSKKAFLASAEAVNQHIGATTKDIWINSLPNYHVGGLSIYARAYLGKTFVYRFDDKWNARQWAQFVDEKRGSLTSLVPTQLWDLIQEKITPPKYLRCIFIGGQKLPLELYEKAKAAGWPIAPTYGMTEMCSQIATASLESPELKILPHVEAKVNASGRLVIKSPALFTGYLSPSFKDPKIEGWFETDDLALFDGKIVTPQGRFNDVIKINGELVNLFQLERLLDDLKMRLNITAETALIPKADPRSGYRLHLFHTSSDILPLIELYNTQVAPFSRIQGNTSLSTLPKNTLGKIAKTLL